jgi:hypothetical protein
MPRIAFVLLVVLGAAGCQGVRDAFTAHADVAARAAGQTLSADRLAELVAHAKRVPVTPIAISSVAHAWVDYALFAVALAQGERFQEPVTVLAATWPVVAQLKWELFHDRLLADGAELSRTQVDSAYDAGTVRLFQHVLLRVPPNAAPDVERERRSRIDDVLRRARGGSGFAQLARQYSDDPGSKARGGSLGISERSDPLVPEFAEAAWSLQPGQISSVVRTSYGFHVIRRPPLAEVRDSFQIGIEMRLQQRLDSAYLDGLARTRAIRVKDNAPAVVRQVMENLYDSWEDRRVLVTFRGGRFRVGDLTHWLHALDPQYVQNLPQAGDEQIRNFLRLLTQRQILILQADSAGVQIEPAEWVRLRVEHDSTLAMVQSALGLSSRILDDSTEGADARVRFAMARVNDYLERVLSSRAQFVPVPPFFGAALRQRGDWAVVPAGIAQAAERAGAARARVDSLSGGDARPPMQPAPGPPPVPGGARRGGGL